MSEELPSASATGRLSQIFETLTNLQQEQQIRLSPNRAQTQRQRQQQQQQQQQQHVQQHKERRRSSSSSSSPINSGRVTPIPIGGGSGGAVGGGGIGLLPQFRLHSQQLQHYENHGKNYIIRGQPESSSAHSIASANYMHTFPSSASQLNHYHNQQQQQRATANQRRQPDQQQQQQHEFMTTAKHYFGHKSAHQYQQQQHQSSLPPTIASQSLSSSPLLTKRATSFSGNMPLLLAASSTDDSLPQRTGISGAIVDNSIFMSPIHLASTTNSTTNTNLRASHSTPTSPLLLPRHAEYVPAYGPAPAISIKPSRAATLSDFDSVSSTMNINKHPQPPPPGSYTISPTSSCGTMTATHSLGLASLDTDAPWPYFSNFTEHPLNSYGPPLKEINWQERCLDLQLELHRSKNQAGRIREMLREKLSELEQRVVESEERAEEAEDKVRAMEQRLSEWPKSTTDSPSHHLHQHNTQLSTTCIQQSTVHFNGEAEKTITSLEIQVEEQRQLRLHDARQVEAKAAKIKEWVTNKLRELEEQNQVLREQNLKCNQQLQLLKNHIANQPNRNSIIRLHPVRNSLSLDVQEFAEKTEARRRSESLDQQEIINRPLTASYPHNQHRRNLSMDPQDLERNLVAAVDVLTLTSLSSISKTSRPDSSSDAEAAHDYAEIYTPSCEKMPAWMKSNDNPMLLVSGGNSSTSTTTSDLVIPRPPTPPLHRFPSWEAKIYQVANDGLVATSHDASDRIDSNNINTNSMGRNQNPQYNPFNAATDAHEGGGGTMRSTATAFTKSNNATLKSNSDQSSTTGGDCGGTPQLSARQQQTASGGFCDISVPVYATVKGRASQIRSIPFTGDSSDDSSDGEENAVVLTHNSHNSSSTDNTETSTSGSASSPSKSLKTASSLSPAKRSGSESPKIPKVQAIVEDYTQPTEVISESICGETAMPFFKRQSFVDSPCKKLETLEKMGHLTKLGGKLKTWRKRWFVLKNGILVYWKSQHDVNRRPQGQISLDEECRITRAEGASTFEIDTGKKVYYLTADSNATMDDWIKILQNVQRRNATKLLLCREDQKPTAQGWMTKVKNGHARKCWCALLGKMFLYFKAPGETNPVGQINMRDARVEEVEHVSDSDSEEREDPAQNQARLTVAIYPAHQGPTYLIFPCKQERDNWLYHLTVVSGSGHSAGTQYEQLVQKLMETDGDPNCMLWRHPILLYSKDAINSPLSSLYSATMQPEAIKLFKSIQLFMSVAVNQLGIDYHVVLAQNALQSCLDLPDLQTEMICILAKQTSRHMGQKLSVGVQVNKKLGKQTRQLLLCATQSLFSCDTQQSGNTHANDNSPISIQPLAPSPIIDCKSNPPAYSFVQGWQLLSLAVSLFVPKSSRLLWYLKLHLSRNADTKTETGKYAAYCERALERTLANGGRETKPSRMEVLSILLKNPYHHSLPHAIPVHMVNGSYQVVSFDGSTTIEEFQITLAQEIGTRDATNGFCLFSDDPIEKDLEHYLDPTVKLCDVISKWETALREKGSGKFENSRVIQLSYKSRLYWKHTVKFETDKERLLLCYQTNAQIVLGRFPLSRDLALELASLMAQIDMSDFSHEKSRGNAAAVGLKALDKFYPYRYRDALSANQLKEVQELLITKWLLLKGRSTLDCVRIYLTCCRKWPFFGASLFQAKPRHSDQAMTWLAVSEDALNVLDLSSMAPIAWYPYTSVMTFGGCQDDFMLVISKDVDTLASNSSMEKKLLFAMSKPKIFEITLLIADYMNALGHTVPGTPQMSSLARNGSHRSLRSSRPGMGISSSSGGVGGIHHGHGTTGGVSTNATTAHNTLNSNASHTLMSQHSQTLSSSHYSGAGIGGSGGGGCIGTGSSMGGGSNQGTMHLSHGLNGSGGAIGSGSGTSGHHHHQPDILKSTPDHQHMKLNL